MRYIVREEPVAESACGGYLALIKILELIQIMRNARHGDAAGGSRVMYSVASIKAGYVSSFYYKGMQANNAVLPPTMDMHSIRGVIVKCIRKTN